MRLSCQVEAYNRLKQLAEEGRHSICIEGPQGSGKTYMAKVFANLLNITDFQKVLPTVNDIRQCIAECCQISNPIVLCIENLDTGAVGASHALLKMLEEPKSNVYVIVTCQNLYRVPDTIVSRSVCVTLGTPTYADLDTFGMNSAPDKMMELKVTPLIKCVASLSDLTALFALTAAQREYFVTTLPELLKFKDTVSNIVWKLGHCDNNEEIDPKFVLRYILATHTDPYIKRQSVIALNELAYNRIAAHAVLAKFVLTCKYTEA